MISLAPSYLTNIYYFISNTKSTVTAKVCKIVDHSMPLHYPAVDDEATKMDHHQILRLNHMIP